MYIFINSLNLENLEIEIADQKDVEKTIIMWEIIVNSLSYSTLLFFTAQQEYLY